MNESCSSQHYQALSQRWGWIVGPDQLGRLGRLYDKFRVQRNLSEPHPVIEQTIKRAYDECGIKEPILTFQDDNSSDSAACHSLFDEKYYPVKALVIGVSDKCGGRQLPNIRKTIFHECGHLVADDQKKLDSKDFQFMMGSMGLSVFSGVYMAKLLTSLPRSGRTLVGITAASATFMALARLYGKVVNPYQIRQTERNADIFAVRKLIKLNDYYAIAYSFLNFTYNLDKGKSNSRNEHWFLHDHPSYLERAKFILDELKKNKVDLTDLPLNKDLYDSNKELTFLEKDEVQASFIHQVNKYFPNYLSNSTH